MSKVISRAVVGTRVLAFRDPAGGPVERDDGIAVEAPLELRLGGRVSTVLMRTPGDDEELVRGFLLSEGIVGALDDIRSMRRPADLEGDEVGNVIEVQMDPARRRPQAQRLFYGSSSCGACGKLSIASLAVTGRPATSGVTVARGVLAGLPERMRPAQATFAETGGVHASALFTAAGDLLALREDVGRHNALDKLIGWGLAEGMLPFSDLVLLVSGRVSYEIVQKAIAAGLPFVAAVGAPSSFAVDLARRFGITLVGFVRGGSMNVYAHEARVADGPPPPSPARRRTPVRTPARPRRPAEAGAPRSRR
jgi:FdhD protein